MRHSTILAFSAPLLVLADPLLHEHLHKRNAITTTTIYEEVTVTVDVTVTVYGPPPQDAAQQQLGGGNQNNNPDCKPTPAAHAEEEKKPSEEKPKVEAHPEPAPPAVQHPAPTPAAPHVEKVHAQPAAPAPQHAKPPPQHVNPPPQHVNPPPQHENPPPEHPAPKPAPQPPKAHGPPQGPSGPSGGSCGQIGGKCMASDVTIYNNQGTGACGWSNDTNSEDFFALAADTFGSYTNNAPENNKNAFCGRMATISINGKTFEGMCTDKCPGCTGWSIDLSQSLWNKAYDNEAPTRKYNVEWWFTGPEIYSPA